MLLLLIAASSAVMSQETAVLDSAIVKLNSSEAVLRKLDDTPSIVDLIVPVQNTVKKCDPADLRTVRDANAEKCGYDLVTLPCYGGGYRGGYPGGYYPGRGYPRGGYGPVSPLPSSGRYPHTGPRGGVVVRVPAPGPACIPNTRKVPRVCTYKTCDRPYYEEVVQNRKFKLTFENYDRAEDFEFSLDRYGNVTLLPLQTKPSCTSLVVYGDKPRVSGAKISIRSGWFSRSCR